MPTRETPDRKESLFIPFLSPARRMKKAVIMMMSSGPIAAQFISSKFIANSMAFLMVPVLVEKKPYVNSIIMGSFIAF
jgi:hypothetical protein